MSRVTVYAWKCDLCNHVWLANGQHPPSRCAKCKATRWNATAITGVQYSDEKVINDLVTHAIARTSVTLSEPEVIRPNMETLRDICAGITEPRRDFFAEGGASPVPFAPLQSIPGPPQAQQPCTYEEYDEQTGETYACGLSAHSAKVKHTRGRRL